MQLKLRLVASALLRHPDGLLLLHRRRHFKEIDLGKGLWELPGGKVGFGEWPARACRREVMEETGWQIRSPFEFQKLVPYRLQVDEVVSHRFNLLFSVPLPALAPATPQMGEEHDDFRFVKTAAELRTLPMLPAIKNHLLRLLP